MTSNSPRQWRSGAADESGQALILAIAIIVIGLLLGLGAVAYALNASKASSGDEHTRGAQQAADSGVQAVISAEAGSAAVGYNIQTGSVVSFLDCTVPEISAGVQVGTLRVQAGSGGCPGAVNASGTPITNPWLSLSNGNFYDTAFFPNAEPQTGNVGASAFSVQFPEIVSVGCNTTASSGATDCAGNVSGNDKYARDLALLDPTAPLQAIEAGNNVYLAGSGTVSPVQCVSLLLGLNLASGLNCLTGNPALILQGAVAAGYDVQVPSVLLGVDASTSITGLVSSLLSLNLGNVISGVLGTIEYGHAYDETNVQPPASSSAGSSYTTSGAPVATVANLVPTSGQPCTAGEPSTSCSLSRPTFTLSASQLLTGTTGTTGMPTLSGTGYTLSGTSASTGDLTMGTGGSITLTTGIYVFCNVNITGGTLTGPSTGSAQIFVLPPGASQCTGDTGSQGNFIDTPGINPPSTLTATINGVTSVVNPSTVQIYVGGNASGLVEGKSFLPSTSVSIGNGSSVTQAAVIYAPASNVSISTTGSFVGSAVGWNVTVSALAVIQDLDLGNYPLASVINGIKVNQNVECSNSVTTLAASTTTTAQATDTAGCT